MKLDTISACLQALEELDPFDIYEWMKKLNLPKCDYCVRLAHAIRGKCLSIMIHTKANRHGIAKMDLDILKKYIAAIEKVDLKEIHKQLQSIDNILGTTH